MTENILSAIKRGENVLIHAPGGTGKTYLLKQIAEKCIEWKKKIACVAPTGVAALGLSNKILTSEGVANISGTTIHSWGGIGIGDLPADKLLEKVLRWPSSKAKWVTVDIIITDEISMVSAELLDKLDYIAKRIRRIPKPFGGIQLVLAGDFLQLPPVKAEWAFKSMIWDSLVLKPFSLYEPQRYPDIKWFQLLLRVRKAQHTPDDIKFLQTRVRAYEKWRRDMELNTDETIIKPTVLHSRRADVDLDNDVELQKLQNKEEIIYNCTDLFVPFLHHAKPDRYFNNLDDAIPKTVTMRIGAQVMLKANLDVEAGYVNGSRGVVVGMSPEMVTVKWVNGLTTEVGQHVWVQEDKEGKASRSQIPLILAWALTIHKAQGATLDYAICNLGPTVFCAGQAYVSLSRVRSSDGLLLELFYPKVITADPDALAFAESIEEREAENQEGETLVENEIEDTVEEFEGAPLGDFEKGAPKDSFSAVTFDDPPETPDVEPEEEIIYFMNFVGLKKKKSSKKIEKHETAKPAIDDYDFQARYAKIKEWRAVLAKEQQVPAYRIINNATLNDICYYKPSSPEELLKIKGMGPASIDNYGDELLKLIKSPPVVRRLLNKNVAIDRDHL